MINMAIDQLENFKVCDIELKDRKKELIYTYNTAVKLTRKYKDIDVSNEILIHTSHSTAPAAFH